MKNKILVKIIVPEIMETMEIFIPVNERISKISRLLSKNLSEKIGAEKDYCLIDADNGTIYDERMIIRDTNIVNAKKIIMF